MCLPDLEHLKTVRQLCEEYPDLFTEGSLRWLIFQRKSNGFDRCVIHLGKRLYIDLHALRRWLAEQRGSRLEAGRSGPPGSAAVRRIGHARGRRS